MESEKVKEIKETLSREVEEFQSEFCQEILTLINELESENEKLAKAGKRVTEINEELLNEHKKIEEQLKDQIAELEKKNAKYKQKLTTNQWVQEIRKEALKQFAERLKEKYRIWETDKQVIDETLKEFI